MNAATVVNRDRHQEVLGMAAFTTEYGAAWLTFPRSLVPRGLTGVLLAIAVDHLGLKGSLAPTLPRYFLIALPTSLFAQPDDPGAQLHADHGGHSGALGLRQAGPGRGAGLRRLFQAALAPNPVQPPPGATQLRDPPLHRCGEHLPQPPIRDPLGVNGPRRADGRVARGGRPAPRRGVPYRDTQQSTC